MLTVSMLSKIEEKKKLVADAKYPTGIIIDITGPEGNVYYLIGLCNDLMRKLELEPEEIKQFQEETEKLPYMLRLAVMQHWFGFIYIHHEDKQ